MRRFVSLGLCSLAAFVAACGGANPVLTAHSNETSGSNTPDRPVAGKNTAVAAFNFSIPAGDMSSATRSPRYISTGTQSFVILTDGSNPQIINVNKSSPSCRPINGGGSLSCAIAVSATVGTHDFTVTAYAQLNGEGPALSTNATGLIRVSATNTTPIAIALFGIVATAELTLQTPNPPVGTSLAIPLTVVLKDAFGAIIVGGAPLRSPITLTSSDTVNGPLTRTIVNAPADEAGISVTYNGASVTRITYAATGNALTAGNVRNAVLSPFTLDAGGPKLYIADIGGSITTFNADGSRSSPTITGGLLTEPVGVAVDAAGKIYVANSFGAFTNGNVTVYNADGTQALSITAGLSFPTAVAVGPTGKIYVANYGFDRVGPGNITTYNADGTQTTPTITVAARMLPMGIAVDAAGKIHVSNWDPSTITTYSADGTPTQPTIDLGEQFSPEGITVDASGKIYVTNDYGPSENETGSVVTFNADGSPATPTITRGVDYPRGVAVDATGKIHVLNWFNNTVTTYTSNGTQTAPTIITGQGGIHGIAVH